jgi:Glycosyl transferase family 2.
MAVEFEQYSKQTEVRRRLSMPGFAASSGDVICMLDSDDFFHANKVERTVRAFLEDPRIHWVFHPVCRAFEDGRRQIVPVVSETIYADVRGHALRGKLPIQGPVTSGIVLSRPLIDCILPMTESIRITADNYIIFLAMALEPGVYLAETLAVQRMHGSNSLHDAARPDLSASTRSLVDCSAYASELSAILGPE